jgi:uncharacterized protein (DUF58 family)
MALFGPDWLLQCEKLSLWARQVGGGPFGVFKKRRGGREAWFTHRDYAPGDAPSRVDWNVCARQDELLTRQVAAEPDLHVYLLLDCSRSMAIGAGGKFAAARRVTAALAQAALTERSTVSVMAYANGPIAELGPLCGRARLPAVLRFLESLAPARGDTDLTRAARAMVRRPLGRGPAVVIGDLIEPVGFQRGLDTLRFAGYPLEVVQIYDSVEAEPNLLGDVELRDIESGAVLRGTITERDAARYREQFAGFCGMIQSYCRRARIGCVSLPSDLSAAELLVRTIGPSAFRVAERMSGN